jgi:tetratricopeptide (TPR) repeat protein
MTSKARAANLPRAWPWLFAAGVAGALTYALWPEKTVKAPDQPPPEAVQPVAPSGAQMQLPNVGAPVSEWVSVSNALMDQGSFALAAEGYSHVLHQDSMNVSVWVDRGACKHALGDLRGAESDFRSALTIAPEHPTAHFNLGIVFFSEGRIDSAKLHFNYVLTAAPGSNEAERARELLAQKPGS